MSASPARLRFEPSGLDFTELNSLQEDLARILDLVDESLDYFYDDRVGGFVRRREDDQPVLAVSSTGTCIDLLHGTGLLRSERWSARIDAMRESLIASEFRSHGLPVGNPYTTSFALIGIARLREASGDDEQPKLVSTAISDLKTALFADGAAQIRPFPPSAFITERVVKALDLWDERTPGIIRAVSAWAWNRIHEESALVASRSQEQDAIDLAYAALLAVRLGGDLEQLAPQQRHILRHALDQFFGAQDADTGLWPRSRPQFVYAGVGNVHCFDQELLAAMLAERKLWPIVFSRLPQLRLAELNLDGSRFAAGSLGVGWASSHHGRSRSPESWATASVFQFCLALAQIVAEALRRHAFDYADAKYSEPIRTPSSRPPAFEGFLDAPVSVDGNDDSLQRVIEASFLEPIARAQPAMLNRKSLPRDVPTSAILFGPPGTSKTQLAHIVANYLGWPLIKLDPSHLMRNGRDGLHAETNRMFQILVSCEEIVVLLDEFDELVRDRDQSSGMESRFLTTAMLPKLAALSERRRIVYLLATNHLEQFDAAVRRPGRFDMVLPVMPPTVEAKCEKWPVVRDGLEALEGRLTPRKLEEACTQVADLTYSETEALTHQVRGGADFSEALERLGARATLAQVLPGEAGETWKQRIAKEAKRTHIPPIVRRP
ncbi:MAG TPA: ATP-binding protein [Solirubrobacterales bacterium]|nr:ATP-binding protein [Solirubrobacterales bacterium]